MMRSSKRILYTTDDNRPVIVHHSLDFRAMENFENPDLEILVPGLRVGCRAGLNWRESYSRRRRTQQFVAGTYAGETTEITPGVHVPLFELQVGRTDALVAQVGQAAIGIFNTNVKLEVPEAATRAVLELGYSQYQPSQAYLGRPSAGSIYIIPPL